MIASECFVKYIIANITADAAVACARSVEYPRDSVVPIRWELLIECLPATFFQVPPSLARLNESQDAVEAGHAFRDPYNARIYPQPLVRIEEDAGSLWCSPDEKRWVEAIDLLQRYQDRTMRFLEQQRRATWDDQPVYLSCRAIEREVRAISEREQQRQAKSGAE